MDAHFTEVTRPFLILGVFVLVSVIALLTLVFRNQNKDSSSGATTAKSEYTDTLVLALLYCDVGKSPVLDIDRVESVKIYDNQIYIECATTEHQLRLGHNSYLVATGVPISCIRENVTLVQLYLGDKLLWEGDVYDFTHGDDGNDGSFKGYLGDGADICMCFGQGLTMFAKLAKVP